MYFCKTQHLSSPFYPHHDLQAITTGKIINELKLDISKREMILNQKSIFCCFYRWFLSPHFCKKCQKSWNNLGQYSSSQVQPFPSPIMSQVQPSSTYVTFRNYTCFFLNSAHKFWFTPWSPFIWIIPSMPFSLGSPKNCLIGSKWYITLQQESSTAPSPPITLHIISPSFIGSPFANASNTDSSPHFESV